MLLPGQESKSQPPPPNVVYLPGGGGASPLHLGRVREEMERVVRQYGEAVQGAISKKEDLSPIIPWFDSELPFCRTSATRSVRLPKPLPVPLWGRRFYFLKPPGVKDEIPKRPYFLLREDTVFLLSFPGSAMLERLEPAWGRALPLVPPVLLQVLPVRCGQSFVEISSDGETLSIKEFLP